MFKFTLAPDHTLYRTYNTPFVGDADFAALNTNVSSDLLFEITDEVLSMEIDFRFYNVNTPTDGTCDAYVFRKKIPGDDSRPFIIGRGILGTGLGVTTEIEDVRAGLHGVRVSNIVSATATKLEVYVAQFRTK